MKVFPFQSHYFFRKNGKYRTGVPPGLRHRWYMTDFPGTLIIPEYMYRFLFIAVVSATAFILQSCHSHAGDDGHAHAETEDAAHEHGTDEIVFTPEQAHRAGLQVDTLRPSAFSEVFEVSGRILPVQGAEATVTATMSGLVQFTALRLSDGVEVSAGTPLLRISSASLADGNPAAAAQAELEAARLAYERAVKLAKEKIIARRELEDARRRYDIAKSTARSLGGENQIRTVTSPLKGFVRNLLVKEGDYVTAGQPLLTVSQNRRVQLRADVPERYFSHLSNIRSANFRPASDRSGKVYVLDELKGRLISVGQSVSAEDYFVPVTFEFNNQDRLVTGSFAQIYLLGNPRSGVLSVPVEALAEAQGLYFVYVQLSDHTYRRQEVKVGATDGQRREILSGVQAGERIVIKGTTQVRLAANASVAPEGHKH